MTKDALIVIDSTYSRFYRVEFVDYCGDYHSSLLSVNTSDGKVPDFSSTIKVIAKFLEGKGSHDIVKVEQLERENWNLNYHITTTLCDKSQIVS